MTNPRPRDPFKDPYNSGPRQHVRGPSDYRNGHQGSISTSASANTNGMSRAEKFEDEKRRIIESCFSKKELDGSPVESYITHIQIVEDGLYPSAPAPPDSGPENKKARAIIVAVRKSGRVRLHKARENNSGTFSIGKTWNLDDLSSIQSWTGAVPVTEQDQQQKSWASDIGFGVVLGKPYYWQASTSREREFFIGSLVKIFRKYTGGKLPEMIGFDSAEQEQIVGQPYPHTSPEPQPRSPLPRPNLPPSYGSRAPSRDGDVPRSRNGLSPPDRMPDGNELRSPRWGDLQDQSSGPGGGDRGPIRRAASGQDSISGMLNQNATPKPRPPFSAKSSQSSLQPALGLPSNPRSGANGPSSDPSQSGDPIRRLGPSSLSRPSTPPSLSKPSEARSDQALTPDPPPEALPERRRPPWQRPEGSFGAASAPSDVSSKFSTPAVTPTQLRTDQLSPPPSHPPPPPPATAAAAKVEQSEQAADAVNVADYPAYSGRTSTAVKEQSTTTSPNNLPTVTEATTSTSPTESLITSPSSQLEEDYRPGLGPMMKKKKSSKELATQLRKAAFAASAFKPRAGGAAERLLAQREKLSSEPDGISGVVPAPLLRGTSNDSRNGTPDMLSPASDARSPPPPPITPTVQLQRTPTEERPQPAEMEQTARPPSPERPRSKSPGRRRRQMQEARISKYCLALDIDSKLVEGRGGDFDDLLTEMGWDGKLSEDKKIEDFEADVRREIGRAQASGWLGHIEQQEGKLDQLGRLFTRTIEECDELDGLLTLYSHELNTLADDVAYIEAQSQGLQVQTANQKLLQMELKNLLKTISISSADLRDLRDAAIGTPEGVLVAEQALSILYKAMITIDPDIRQNKKRQADAAAGSLTDVGVYADTEIGQMRAVREKKEMYREETSIFLKRLSHYVARTFKVAEARTGEQLDRTRANAMVSDTSLDSNLYDTSRQEMWMYHALMLFVREVNSYEWQTLISTYETCLKSAYQEQLRRNIHAWKTVARTPMGEELDLLFTTQEKEKAEDGIATAARKLTVKRGKAVRATSSLGKSVGEKRDGKIDAHEAVAGVLDGHLKLISEEQNFSVSFFHLSSLSHADFADTVAARPPAQRKLPNLSAKQTYDPDRDMARIVERMMDNIYATWPADMQLLVDWALSNDPLQGVGILYSLERSLLVYEDTNQEYLTRTLRSVHARLLTRFQRFIDDQVRGIEDTRVKFKKRKGIVSFMRTFPNFSAAVESVLPPTASGTGNETLEVRLAVNEAYTKVNRAMWECLNFIAKDEPGSSSGPQPAGGGGGGMLGGNPSSAHAIAGSASNNDPEDKEALNYHILLIENMNHYLEEVESRSNPVLKAWRERAAEDLSSHLAQYTDAVIRRPLGKWLDFIETTEATLNAVDPNLTATTNSHYNSDDKNSNTVSISSSTMDNLPSSSTTPALPPPSASTSTLTLLATKPTHSRNAVKKLLAAHDAKEIRKGVETLKKRIEKHFAEGDDPALARGLVGKVFSECVARYGDAWERMRVVVKVLHGAGGMGPDSGGGGGGGSGLEIEWRKEEVMALFKR